MLPAFNEENSVEVLLSKIARVFSTNIHEYEIITINDGSTDETFEILQKMKNDYPLEIVLHKINRGLGETERDGFEFLAEKAGDNDIIIRMDCDDTHEPDYILALIDKIEEGYDVVNTSRFRQGGGQKGLSPYRTIVSYSANVFMRLLFNIPNVRDYSCGYRAYRAKVIKDAVKIFGNGFIQLKGLGFTSTLETIVKLKMMGCRFSEVPFILRYDNKVSLSKMVGSITTLGYLIMAVLYHWPFGGWRVFYKDLAKTYNQSPDDAYDKFAWCNTQKSDVCQIGG